MGFTASFVKKELIGGLIYETGTFVSDAGTATGNITADTTIQPEIQDILLWSASSNGDTAVICARDAGLNVLKLTFTGNDSGTYTIVGKGA